MANPTELQARKNVPIPEQGRTSYNFDKYELDDSVHVATDRERRNLLIAFKYWAKHIAKKPHRYVISRKVDETDPDGAGFRIWFKSKKADASQQGDEI